MLSPARPEDMAAIGAIERLYAGNLGQWSDAVRAAHMDLPGNAHFVWREGGAVRAFAIMERLNDPDGWAYLRRIAAGETGAGAGGQLLRAVLTHVFAKTATKKIELRCRSTNDRARALYLRLGFVVEGELKRGDHASHSMTLLREDWPLEEART